MSQSSNQLTNAGEVQPAATTWTAAMPRSLEDRIAFFKREGFLVLRDLIDAAQVQALKDELDRLAREHETLPRIREGFGLEPTQDGGRSIPTFRKMGGITDLSEPFHAHMRHPRVLEILHALMGPRIQLWRDVYDEAGTRWPGKAVASGFGLLALGADEPCLRHDRAR